MDLVSDLFDLPWERISPMVGTISLILFAFGPKLGFVRRFFGEAIQDFVGVTSPAHPMPLHVVTAF